MTRLILAAVALLLCGPAFGQSLCRSIGIGEGGSTRAFTSPDWGNELVWYPSGPSTQSWGGSRIVDSGHDDPIDCTVDITGWMCMAHTSSGGPAPERVTGSMLFAWHRPGGGISKSMVLQISEGETTIEKGAATGPAIERKLATPIRLRPGDTIAYQRTPSPFVMRCHMVWKKVAG